MKRLYINPVTRTITPKYRTQKAVYIAKNDHNSVLLGFEIPQIVDGHDISADGNIIHIHYANISKDETSVSRGMSEAEGITVDNEEGTVTFSWRVPNTATRYAGVVSIGVTIERYEDVDGTPQEVYSWSTAPYGGTIVQDSMDNSDEVCEGDFDYLVKTCNAIVDLALKDKIADVEQYKADVQAMRDEVEGYRNIAERYSESAVAASEKVYAFLHGDDDIVQGSKEKNVVRLHELTEQANREAKIHADMADGWAQDAYIYYEQTKKHAQDYCNAIIGTAIGDNAVRIDDVSTVPHNIDIKLKSVNLIDMLNATTNGYSLPVEHGKTYTLSAKLKDNVVIGDRYWGIRWTADDTGAGESRDNMLFHSGTSREASHTFTVGIDNSRDYYIDGNGFTRDDFEYIQLNEGATALPYTPYIDVSNVKLTSYGKNIFDNSKDSWEVSGIYYVKPLPLPDDIPVTVSGHYFVANPNGIIYIQRSIDGGAFTTITGSGILAGSIKRNINLKKQKNENYRLLVTAQTLTDINTGGFLKGVQVEVGTLSSTANTEYEEYKEPVDRAVAVSPTTTLVADTNGVEITAKYNKDINSVIVKLEKAIANL